MSEEVSDVQKDVPEAPEEVVEEEVAEKPAKLLEGLPCRIISMGNFKGGTGKTSNTILISYALAKLGYKILVVDLDPQANATKDLVVTKMNLDKEVFALGTTIMAGIKAGSIDGLEFEVIENLYLLPSHVDFDNFPRYLIKSSEDEKEEAGFLEPFFKPLREKYDFIFLDLPPMNKEITAAATYISDYVIINLQTQERSLQGAQMYMSELVRLVNTFRLKTGLLGILPVLTKPESKIDNRVLVEATEIFTAEAMFKKAIPTMERVKRWSVTGITENDAWDKRTLSVYDQVAKEFLTRIGYYEGVVDTL